MLKEALEAKAEEYEGLILTTKNGSDHTINRKELLDKQLAASKLLDKVQKQMCARSY